MSAQFAQVQVSTAQAKAAVVVHDKDAVPLVLEQGSPVRGIATAVILATPFWMIVGLAVYILH